MFIPRGAIPMTLTTNQKKCLWLAVIVAAIYYMPSVATMATKAPNPRQVPPPTPTKAQATPAVVPAPSFRDLIGKYSGRATLPGRGNCGFQFELRDNPAKPGTFAGYSSFVCTSMVYWQRTLPSVKPTTAILSGESAQDAIRFHVDDTVSASTCGPMTTLSARRFGSAAIAVEWLDRCKNGAMVLAKIGK